MNYPDENEPTQEAAAGRVRVIRAAMVRLENLASESEELSAVLHNTFSAVLVHEPQTEPKNEKSSVAGSDLGQSLMRVADQLDETFHAIRRLMDSADL